MSDSLPKRVEELLSICADALHTLENEVAAGTRFDEPDWVKGTIDLLKEAIG